MNPEEINVEEVEVEEVNTTEVNQEGVKAIEDGWVDLKAQYEAGAITWDELLDTLVGTLEGLREAPEASPSVLGGLGGGDFPLPEPEE